MIISCDMVEKKTSSSAKATEDKQKKEGMPDGQVYELGYHILSSLNEGELEAAVNTLRGEITKHGGSFIAEGTPELLDLAYTMDVNEGGKHTKYDSAYFGWLKFEMDPTYADKLKYEALETNKNILRYILIKTVREDTRAQVREETLKTLEEVKTTGTIAKKPVVAEKKTGEEVSDKEIDKAVEELVGEADTSTEVVEEKAE